MTSFERRMQRLEEIEEQRRQEEDCAELAAFYGLPVADVQLELERYEQLQRDNPLSQRDRLRATAAEFDLDPDQLAAQAEARRSAFKTWRLLGRPDGM